MLEGKGAQQVPPTARRDRSATLGGCDFFNFPCGLWPESSEEHLPTSIAGVPVRQDAFDCAHKTLCYAIDLRGASLRMTPFWRGFEQHLVGCKKHEKIKKSQTLGMTKLRAMVDLGMGGGGWTEL